MKFTENTSDRYMHLKLKINSDDVELRNKYIVAAEKHNQNMNVNLHPDAGFDLFSTEMIDCSFSMVMVNKFDFKVQCSAAMVCENGKIFPTGFYLYPRSSTGSKTPLRLANSAGIIDSGYRGNLMAFFDCVRPTFLVSKYEKLVQICAPGLVPIYVEIVDDLGVDTVRGSNGFGSTS